MSLIRSLADRYLPHRRKQAAKHAAIRAVIGQSPLFDAAWYVERYPDIAAAGVDPLDHFIMSGAAEGRHPSAAFDLKWYLRRNPDVARSGGNPLLHYLENGRHEGRSIRGVGTDTAIDDIAVRPAKASKARQDKAADTPAYPSDYKSEWTAGPTRWSGLAADDRPVASFRPILAGRDVATWASAPGVPASGNRRAHVFFQAWDSADRPGFQALAELRQPGLGLAGLADAWFADRSRLLVRLPPAAGPGERVRAFQPDDEGRIWVCADALLPPEVPACVAIAMQAQLAPVLILREDANGDCLDSAVLAFPSLLRGGLHHAEWHAVASQVGDQTMEGYMLALLDGLCAETGPLLVGGIAVPCAGASGSERIFQRGLLRELGGFFGIATRLADAPAAGPLAQLAGKLGCPTPDMAMAARRAGGLDLEVPADAVPSLACLASPRQGYSVSSALYCEADALSGKPLALVEVPALPEPCASLNHPALPPALLRPAMIPDRIPPRPAMIRFRDARIWQVDVLQPLSPDVPLPLPSGEEQTSRVTVVVHAEGNPDHLGTCLRALDRQYGTWRLDIVLLGDADCRDRALHLATGRAQVIGAHEHLAEAGPQLRETAAGSDFVVFLSSQVCLQDPRSLLAMAAVAKVPGVASASCSLMQCTDEPGSIPDGHSGQPVYEICAMGDTVGPKAREMLQLFPATVVPVSMNTARLAMFASERLAKPGAGGTAPRTLDDWLDAAAERGGRHACLTLVRAIHLGGPAMAASDAGHSTEGAALSGPVAIRRLGR